MSRTNRKDTATTTSKSRSKAKAQAAAPAKSKTTATTTSKPRPKTKAQAAAPAKSKTTTVKQTQSAKKKPVVHFSEAALNEFRQELMKLRNDLSRKVSYLQDTSLRKEDGVHDVEDGSDAFDRFSALKRAGGMQRRIYAIDEALREMDDGTYGICQVCESLISKQRLLALPFARNCIDCQTKKERLGPDAIAAPRRFVP